MANDPRRDLGQLGEQHALDHLERLGFVSLTRNYRTRWGEIDLIVWSSQAIVFVEVKTRRARGRSPFESLGPAKQRQVRRMASAWLAEERSRPRTPEIRFDAIGVTINGRGQLVALEHLEAAF
jgi:putative endonuclease